MTIALLFFHALILFSIAYFVWRKQEAGIRFFFWLALLIKLSAGVALGLMYKHYYHGGDTFIFFKDALQLSNLCKTDPIAYLNFLWSGNESMAVWSLLSEIQPRSLFFSKIVSVISVAAGDNYWITALYLSFTSFFGSWYLIKKIVQLIPNAKVAAVFSFAFFPTVVFWSSGMVKESLAMAALFFLSGFFLLIATRHRITVVEWILVPLCIWVLWMLKYYWAVVFLPAAVTTLLIQRMIVPKLNSNKFSIQILIWLTLFLFLCSGAMVVHPNFYPEYFLNVIIENNQEFNSISEPTNLIHFYNLQPTWISIVLNAPWALFSGLLRPFFFESSSVIKFLYSLENLVILILLVTSLKNMPTIWRSSFRLIVCAVLVYSVILCVFLALSSPNFGTLARYRVGFLPFLIFILTYKNPLLEKLLYLADK